MPILINDFLNESTVLFRKRLAGCMFLFAGARRFRHQLSKEGMRKFNSS